MLAERDDDRASLLAVTEGCAVEGPWVSPERREDVERISARSCFLSPEDLVRILPFGAPWGVQLGDVRLVFKELGQPLVTRVRYCLRSSDLCLL